MSDRVPIEKSELEILRSRLLVERVLKMAADDVCDAARRCDIRDDPVISRNVMLAIDRLNMARVARPGGVDGRDDLEVLHAQAGMMRAQLEFLSSTLIFRDGCMRFACCELRADRAALHAADTCDVMAALAGDAGRTMRAELHALRALEVAVISDHMGAAGTECMDAALGRLIELRGPARVGGMKRGMKRES
jgi:hypothetical protein